MSENYVRYSDSKGSINISEEVIGSIVKAAVIEVNGVSGFANIAGGDIADFIGLKSASKGLKVKFDNDKIVVDVIINVTYGCNIYSVAQEVQDAVITTIQSTTGIKQCDVNVHVAGISLDK